MEQNKKTAAETRAANEAIRCAAYARANEEIAEAIKGLNTVINDPAASIEEKLHAGELVVALKKDRI